MAHLHRALRLLLVFCAALSAQLAYGQFQYNTNGSYINTDRVASCTAYAVGFYGAGYGGQFRVPDGWAPNQGNTAWTSIPQRGPGDGPCKMVWVASGATVGNTIMSYRFVACTGGKTFDAATNSCVTPPPTCPTAGTSAGAGRVTLSAAQKSATATNGGYYYWRDENDCVVKLSLDVCTTGDNGATWQCAGSESYTGGYDQGSAGDGTGNGSTGTATTPSTTPPPGEENKPTSCPTGQCPGEVNGLSVCKPCSSVSTKTPKVEEKTNNDGTKEQKETLDKTTCTGTQCTTESTTTTTNKDASGAVTGTSTITTVTVQSKGDFCKDNPNAEQCKDEKGEWGGSCAAGFTCSGDAVQCAIAREVHRANCELNAATAASGLYDAAKDVAGNTTGTNPNNSTFAITSGSFNTSDAIGGAQCIQDLSVEVWGSALSLPLSSICGPLGYLGNLLVLVSLLLAARIVTRG